MLDSVGGIGFQSINQTQRVSASVVAWMKDAEENIGRGRR